MNTIAHISDIHLSPLPQVRPTDLLNKRITGYVNWKLKRKDQSSTEALRNLVQHIRTQRPDMVAVTGDLINLGLPDEIQTGARWLKRLGPAERVCFVPGNHDAYVGGAEESARRAYGAYAAGDTLDDAPYPFVRRVGQMALIGCSSAVVTPPFIAAGHFGKKQAERLAKCLQFLGDAGYYRTILIHHPPSIEARRPYRKALFGAKLFREVVAEHGAEMVLHGHTHVSSIYAIEGNDIPVPVIGVAAASTPGGTHLPPARYNLFQIEKLSQGWSCTMREFGYQRIGTDVVQRLQVRIH